MKTLKHLLISTATLASLTLSLFGLITPANAARQKNPPPLVPTVQVCNNQAKLPLSSTTLTVDEKAAIQPYLNRLAIYQNTCASMAFKKVMVFSSIPANPTVAQQESIRMANILIAFNKVGLTPIVVAEPNGVNFAQFAQGAYNESLSMYFEGLKSKGVTEAMMGRWIPFPEPNIPVWDNKGTLPAVFVNCFNLFMEKLRSSYPSVKGSILLNTMTFAPEDVNWMNGSYSSLVPYGAGINLQYLDHVGVQGFPWVSTAGIYAPGYIKNASTFLPPRLAIDLAKAVGTKRVLINTGSFSKKYTLDPTRVVTIPYKDRVETMNSILASAEQIRSGLGSGSIIAMNIFAQDKSQVSEATNFSFQTNEELLLLKSFLNTSYLRGYDMSYFDITN
ncbi:MAG: hypothetical protein ACRCXZ_05560 [Patescibacteria group bacterium]